MMLYEVNVTVHVSVEAHSQEEAEALVKKAVEENGLPVLEYLPGYRDEDTGSIMTYEEI